MTRVLFVLVLAANLVCAAAFFLDKRRAIRGGRRVPERTLLLLALPLAAPGAWLAMALVRHKTRKVSFRLALAVVTLLNGALAWGVWHLVAEAW